MPSRRAPRAKSARVTRSPAVTVDPDQLAMLLERAVRAGAAPQASSVTFAEHWEWWKPRFLSRLGTARDFEQRVRVHLLPSVGDLTEETLTPDVIELALAELEGRLSAGTLNHVRAHGRKIINDAIRARRWRSGNPFAAVLKRKVAKLAPYILSPAEARRVIALASKDIAPRWAVLLGLGVRFGELRGLRVEDFDDENGKLHVRRSGTRDTTKTGAARSIPLPPWIAPYLLSAVKRTSCDWLFPGKGGKRQLGRYSKGQKLLSRALRRAQVVDTYEHWCGRRGCGFTELHRDPDTRRCPADRRALHIRGVPKKVRVHDLRHAFVSLAQQAEIHPAVVSLVAGHSQVSITQSVYTHLSDDFVRAQLEKLDLTPTQADFAETMGSRPSKPRVPSSSLGWRKNDTEREDGATAQPTLSGPPSPFLSTAEVARRLGASDDFVRLKIHSGELPATCLGKVFRVRESDLEAFIAARQVGAPS